MRRCGLRTSATFLLSCAYLAACGAPTPEVQPHPIIIVDIDTLRADHLGVYGYDRPTSPNLDTFAQEAIVFDWAFSQAPNTPPSQTSILTGLYPSTHRMIYDEDKVPDRAVTLAEALAAQGFETAGFHDGGYMSQAFNMGQGFATYDNSKGKGLEVIGPKVEAWLREHHESNFLLLIHTYDVHTPYAPPAPFADAFTSGLAAPSPGFEPTSKQMEKVRLSKYTDTPLKLADNDLAYARALYDGGILYVDSWFGEFMQLLRELGLDERATIMVISDHGEEFQEHGSVLHEKLYATVTHVPWMMRLPGGEPAGRIDRVVETVDLVPSVLSLVGVEIPENVQGHDLLPLLQGSPASDPAVAFGESPFFGERRFIASDDLRLLYTLRDQTVELYRYRTDPDEQVNLADESPAEVERLRGLLERWQAMVSATVLEPTEETPAELDPETLEELRALGYIQ